MVETKQLKGEDTGHGTILLILFINTAFTPNAKRTISPNEIQCKVNAKTLHAVNANSATFAPLAQVEIPALERKYSL